MPGRPKPTPLKLIGGNPGKRPLPENEPKPYPKAPECPADIDKDAKKVWKRLGPKLEKLGLLTETDGDLFSMLCQIRSRLVWIHGELDMVELLDRNANPNQADMDKLQHALIALSTKRIAFLLKEERLYSALLRQYATEFGLSPRGRVGLTVGGKEVEDDDI